MCCCAPATQGSFPSHASLVGVDSQLRHSATVGACARPLSLLTRHNATCDFEPPNIIISMARQLPTAGNYQLAVQYPGAAVAMIKRLANAPRFRGS
jgi:hypothetical protein